MVNMLKVIGAITILLAIIALAMFGKKALRVFIFKTATAHNTEGLWLESITAGLTIIIALAYYIQNEPIADPFMWTGLLIFIAGWAFQFINRKHLGDDMTYEDRLKSGFDAAQLGIYSKLRHPSQSALIVILLGFSLALGSIWACAMVLLLVLPSAMYRISQEERALYERFGERWIEYKEETKRMIPYVF
jgi:protein-S-isoprenylcysteine O-methyltransferase Ste14